jgi:hypothetical protein
VVPRADNGGATRPLRLRAARGAVHGTTDDVSAIPRLAPSTGRRTLRPETTPTPRRDSAMSEIVVGFEATAGRTTPWRSRRK